MGLFKRTKKEQPEYVPVNWNDVVGKMRDIQFHFPWRGRLVTIPTKTIHKICLYFCIGVLLLMVWTVTRYFLHKNDQPLVVKRKPTVEELIKETPVDNAQTRIRFKELRRRAMDSLVDNKILTVENIKAVETLYPDSLCDCK